MPTIAGANRKQAGLYYDKGGAIFNVMHPDFGALGGGTVDDSTALGLAIAAAGAAGGVVEIPPGTFKADPPASIPAGVTIRGAGIGRTTINAATTAGKWSIADASNVTLKHFTFVGKSNSGAATTAEAVLIRAIAADVLNVTVRDCEFKNFKIEGVIRVGGNGDLFTPATFVTRGVRVGRNKISQYYDINPGSIGQIAAAIYFFGGSIDPWIFQNLIDGTFGKQGILFQTEGNGISIDDNKVNNCGLTNNSDGSYAIAAYSGDVSTVAISEIGITRNKINYCERAGIYLAGIKDYGVNDNIVYKADQHSTGMGTVGAGAIFVNNGVDDVRNGAGTVNNNRIVDPGFCCINLSLGTFRRADVEVVGNIGKMQTAGLSRKGLVVNGHGANIGPNTWRGFTDAVLINNGAADDCGDLSISHQQIDGTGAAGSPAGIRVNSATFHVGPLEVNDNQIRGVVTGIDLRPVSDLGLCKNQFTGAPTAAIIAQGLERARIEGNTADGGTNGLNIALKAATATARASVGGNLMIACTTPCVVTENTGLVIFGPDNDFVTKPGRAPDVGDASIASGMNEPYFEVVPFSTTLTANRSATFSMTRAFRGCRRTVLRDAPVPGAFAVAVIDDVGATVYTMLANQKGFASLECDGTHWKLKAAGAFA